MRIIEVTTGMLPVPPNGWGAVEKIIWQYKIHLEKLGHQVDVLYLSQVKGEKADIVHCHIANLANECFEMGIPYVFSLHDHHAFHYGKDSRCYQDNLRAIKNSIVSFCHAEYMIDYFDTDKLFFLSHGVDTTFFKPNFAPKTTSLLMVANNGLAGDSTFDRKGFRYGIEAAKELGLPITVVGTENNLKWFEANKDLCEYEYLKIVADNPSEEKLLKLYQEHTIFLHPSMLEAGHPNLTILEAIACGLVVAGVYSGSAKIDSIIPIERDTKSIVKAIQSISSNKYNPNRDAKLFDWSIIVGRLEKMFHTIQGIKSIKNSTQTTNAYLNFFGDAQLKKSTINMEESISITHLDGLRVELNSKKDSRFNVSISTNGVVVFNTDIKSNMWVTTSDKHFNNKRITIKRLDDGVIIYDKEFEFKKVYIHLDSKSLGDTLAWMPYVQKFKEKHNCEVVVSTFHNKLFNYPELEFVEPSTVVHNIQAMYQIGWFFDKNKEPEYPVIIPLQKAATNILGLEYEEIRPHLNFTPKTKPYNFSYVAIASSSTAECKLWTKEGWQKLVMLLKQQGFEVVSVSKESTNLKDVYSIKDTSIENTMNVIYHAEFFIGLSSGLSWLAWAMEKKVVMIANFSAEWHEFQDCVRITDKALCHGCWNMPFHKFDAGDWNWCPIHKGTNRQHECHKKITPETVFETIKNQVLC